MYIIKDIFNQMRFGENFNGEIENSFEIINGQPFFLQNCKNIDGNFIKINPKKISKLFFVRESRIVELIEKEINNNVITFVEPIKNILTSSSLGIDVSDDPKETDFSLWKENKNIDFAIIRTSVCRDNDYYYGSDNAKKQIENCKTLGITALPYHNSHFGSDVEKAILEAEYSVKKAEHYGIKTGYIALDYEWTDSKDKNKNTQAVITYMNRILELGYKPILYCGIHFLRTKLNIEQITNLFGRCLWFASYKSDGKIESPDLEYFNKLSIDNVLIWQFTRHYYVEGQDESITMDGNLLLENLILRQ